MIRILLSILMLGLLVGCQNDKKETKKEAPLRFQTENLLKRSGTNCETASYDCSIIELDVMRASGKGEVSEIINRQLDEQIIKLVSSEKEPDVDNLQALTEKFMADYEEAAQNFTEEPAWEAYVQEEIKLETEKIISVGLTAQIFSGGAHGYSSLTFLNFDPQSGDLLTEEDLFTPAFSDFVEKRFRKEQEIPAESNINSTGFWFENDIFHLPENIGFTPDKVILVYNAYEIAPYAAGDFVMEIPREEIRDLLKIK